MDNTILQQGRFTSDGTTKMLQIRSDVDWMKIYNTTVAAASQTTALGVEYYWQRGFPNGAMWEYKKSNAANAANLSSYATSGGFTLVDTSENPNTAVNTTITAISNAATPVVSLTDTATQALVAGDVVRLINVTGGQQLGGIDFTIGSVVANTSFTLAYMAQIVAATTGSFRKIKWDPIFYPRRRVISKITQASSAVVTMTVTHGFTVGQQVRFIVPAAFGMTQMNQLSGEISAINTTNNTITVNIDSSAFTAFAFPLTAGTPFSPAYVVPLGEGTDASIASPNLLDDATENQAYIGMQLAAGADSPAGQTSDVIYWVAGKSFSVSNS